MKRPRIVALLTVIVAAASFAQTPSLDDYRVWTQLKEYVYCDTGVAESGEVLGIFPDFPPFADFPFRYRGQDTFAVTGSGNEIFVDGKPYCLLVETEADFAKADGRYEALWFTDAALLKPERLKLLPKPLAGRSIKITGADDETIAGMVNAGVLDGVTVLSVSRCRIGDDTAIALCKRLPDLEYLDITATDVGDRGFLEGVVSFCGGLRGLSIRETRITEASYVKGISKLATLRNLYLGDWSGTSLTDRAIVDGVCAVKGLRKIDIMWASSPTDVSMAALSGLPELRSLVFSCPKVTDRALMTIAKNAKKLMELRFGTGRNAKQDDALVSLGAMQNLKILHLNTDYGVEWNEIYEPIMSEIAWRDGIGKLGNLKVLGINGARITEADARDGLGRLENLEFLQLMGSDLNDRTMSVAFANLHKLKRVYLNDCKQAGDDGAIALCVNNPGMDTLYISQSTIGDRAFVDGISRLKSLRTLNVWGNRRLGTDGVVALCEGCPDLLSLDMLGAQVDVKAFNEGVASLKKLVRLGAQQTSLSDDFFSGNPDIAPRLKVLVAHDHTELTDRFAKEVLPKMRNLYSLTVAGTRISEEALYAALPRLPRLYSIDDQTVKDRMRYLLERIAVKKRVGPDIYRFDPGTGTLGGLKCGMALAEIESVYGRKLVPWKNPDEWERTNFDAVYELFGLKICSKNGRVARILSPWWDMKFSTVAGTTLGMKLERGLALERKPDDISQNSFAFRDGPETRSFLTEEKGRIVHFEVNTKIEFLETAGLPSFAPLPRELVDSLGDRAFMFKTGKELELCGIAPGMKIPEILSKTYANYAALDAVRELQALPGETMYRFPNVAFAAKNGIVTRVQGNLWDARLHLSSMNVKVGDDSAMLVASTGAPQRTTNRSDGLRELAWDAAKATVVVIVDRHGTVAGFRLEILASGVTGGNRVFDNEEDPNAGERFRSAVARISEGSGRWEAWDNIRDFSCSNGRILGVARNDDPYFGAEGLSIGGAEGQKIVVRFKAGSGDSIGMYWITEDAPEFDEEKAMHLPLVSDGQFRDYVFDVGARSEWAGKRITGLRIDPTEGGPGGPFEIESIKGVYLSKSEREALDRKNNPQLGKSFERIVANLAAECGMRPGFRTDFKDAAIKTFDRWNSPELVVKDGAVIFAKGNTEDPAFVRPSTMKPGKLIALRFRKTPGARFAMDVERGTWDTPDFQSIHVEGVPEQEWYSSGFNAGADKRADWETRGYEVKNDGEYLAVWTTTEDGKLLVNVYDANGREWSSGPRLAVAGMPWHWIVRIWEGSIKLVDYAEYEIVKPASDFAKIMEVISADPAGWYPLNQMKGLDSAGTTLKGTATGGDPSLERYDMCFQGDRNQTIVIRAKAESGKMIALYWCSNDTNTMDETKSIHLPLIADGKFHDYVFKVGSDPDWIGKTISGLRIDPTEGGPGGPFEIELIKGLYKGR